MNFAQTVMICRQPIAAHKTEYSSGNSVHSFIEFLLLSHTSLNNPAVQLFAWLRIIITRVPYCRSVLHESSGELPGGLPCVVTETVLARGSVDDR